MCRKLNQLELQVSRAHSGQAEVTAHVYSGWSSHCKIMLRGGRLHARNSWATSVFWPLLRSVKRVAFLLGLTEFLMTPNLEPVYAIPKHSHHFIGAFSLHSCLYLPFAVDDINLLALRCFPASRLSFIFCISLSFTHVNAVTPWLGLTVIKAPQNVDLGR